MTPDVPVWLQWGSFGLLCAVLGAAAWFIRWIAREYFANLLLSLRELVAEVAALKTQVTRAEESLERIEAALGGTPPRMRMQSRPR